MVLIVFYFDIGINQIHTFIINLNEERIITSHLMSPNFFMIKMFELFAFM